MGEARRVLVTGSGGAVGRWVAPGLRGRGHFVRGFDRQEHEGCDEVVTGDIADPAAVDRATDGCDTVIHLAAEANDAPFLDTLLRPNVAGLFCVLDAARRLGVKRVVLASTMQVINGHRGMARPVRVEDGPSPCNHYALTKVWAEQAGEMYSRCYGLEVLAVRIGWFVRNVGEAERMQRRQSTTWYFSHDDALRFFAAAVEATLPSPYHVLFALSANDGRVPADMEPARRVLGYEPRDSFPQGLGFAFDPLTTEV